MRLLRNQNLFFSHFNKALYTGPARKYGTTNIQMLLVDISISVPQPKDRLFLHVNQLNQFNWLSHTILHLSFDATKDMEEKEIPVPWYIVQLSDSNLNCYSLDVFLKIHEYYVNVFNNLPSPCFQSANSPYSIHVFFFK